MEKNQIEQEHTPIIENKKIEVIIFQLLSEKNEIFIFITRWVIYKNEFNVQVNPNSKGVVNPIFKGLFDNVADKMCAVNAFQNATEKDIPEVFYIKYCNFFSFIII